CPADAVDVGVVEDVECLADELEAESLGKLNIFGNPRVERNGTWQVERISSYARCAVRGAVGVVVKVRIYHGGVRLAGLSRQDSAELPTTQDLLGSTRKPLSIVESPDSTQDKPVALVIDARGAIRADVARIGN